MDQTGVCSQACFDKYQANGVKKDCIFYNNKKCSAKIEGVNPATNECTMENRPECAYYQPAQHDFVVNIRQRKKRDMLVLLKESLKL